MKTIPQRTSKSGYWTGNNWVNTTTVAPAGKIYTTATTAGTWSTVSPIQQSFRWIGVCSCNSEKVVAECLVCDQHLCFGCFILHYADRHAQEAIAEYEKNTPAT